MPVNLGVCDCTQVAIATPGPPGTPGTPGSGGGACCTVEAVTGMVIGGHRLVVPNNVGEIVYADSENLAHLNRPIWLSTGAWGSGVVATVTSAGTVTEGSWNWTPGLPIWLGVNGQLTQTTPLGSQFIQRVATVITPTTIEYRPHQPITLI